MRFVLVFNGTRGDIQPAVVLGTELLRRGHDVVFGAPPNLVGFAAGAGLDARPFGYDTRAHINSDVIRHGVRTGGPITRVRALAEIRDHGWNQMVDEMFELVEDADAIVTGFTTAQIAFAFAERGDVPFFVLHHAPVTENPYFSPFPGAPLTLPARVNAVSWTAVTAAFWMLTRGRENRLRQRLGLGTVKQALPARMQRYGAIELQLYDPVFCPDLARVWGERRPLVGFIDLPQGLRRRIGSDALDADTDLWIDSGDPPIYFGFGSMPVPDAHSLLTAIEEACRKLGQRALVCAGWSDFEEISTDRIRVVATVDHDQVFARCRAVVHHGGAGTTSAAVRAGKPALVCWLGSDQPFWGLQLERLGVGVSTPLTMVDVEVLEENLEVILRAKYTERAAEVASRLRSAEEATADAVDLIENSARQGRTMRLSA
ncbi:UDP:flavonoid glycosyltransferase YjiC (YdhE family) [Williamsia limnetica]|uniref:UDP:flavonoid glycosyltransferase YjiC (YdhE family) n=1 Tax=Williamsia limnetica TaxID=882452 RepID=A0A318RIF4_WILLI|nr:glycosyltransferase [Williamsia limnetica]PYE14736.1 UDP:flavonoid glycosyltransferase YjiC (YdhE family) [Williamsia limnetica]